MNDINNAFSAMSAAIVEAASQRIRAEVRSQIYDDCRGPVRDTPLTYTEHLTLINEARRILRGFERAQNGLDRAIRFIESGE